MSAGIGAAALRWLKFNLVGGVGIAVQLLLLAFLASRLPYLAATALAVELTVLHNFAWHERFTWRVRSLPATRGSSMGRLVRFHVSNGFVSLGGNLLLMAVFTGRLHLPVLGANIIAIGICSVINFLLADRWVFAAKADGSMS